MNRFTISLLLLLAGCSLGDRSAVRIVSLQFSAAQNANTPLDKELQDALTVIDQVLVSNGLTQIPSPPAGFSDGAMRHYQGPPTRGCSISMYDQRLKVLFLEFGEPHSTEPVKRLCATLEKELESHYGSQRVRVETRK